MQQSADGFPSESDVHAWFTARKASLALTSASHQRRRPRQATRTLSILWHEAQALLFGLFARGADTVPFARALESLVISVQPFVRTDPDISGNLYYFSGKNLQKRVGENLERLARELRGTVSDRGAGDKIDDPSHRHGWRGSAPDGVPPTVDLASAKLPEPDPTRDALPKAAPVLEAATDEAAFASLLQKLRTADRECYTNTLLNAREAAFLGDLGNRCSVQTPAGIALGSLPELLKQLKLVGRNADWDGRLRRLLAAVNEQ